MSKEQLSELIKSLSAYLICVNQDMAIVDRTSLEEAISELRCAWENMP